MAEKDADNNPYPFENVNKTDSDQDLSEGASADPSVELRNKKEESLSFDLDSYLPVHDSSLRKEENPFSFKKFLNQDSSAQKNKGARKKVYTSGNVPNSNKSDSSHSLNKSHVDLNSRIVNTTDVSSVLPDFVQDHLVIEQCYLSGSSSTVDIDNLNLQNLPDLNLEHRNVHFMLNSDRKTNHSSQNPPDHFSTNLPDFTLGARNFPTVSQTLSDSVRLPDFTLNGRTDSSNESCRESYKDRTSKRNDTNNGNEASQSTRQKIQISSSPSVPLDLPSYDSNDSIRNSAIPFDLTIPAEEKTNSRGMTSSETVSKSLPDFLSDGPIKKEFDENLQNIRGNNSLLQNGQPSSESISLRSEQERLFREIEYLRRQLSEKIRRIEILETELEHLHSSEQRETASLECALQEVENNLKQTAKRALNAEETVIKLKQENKLLKSEICSLRSENVELRLGNYDTQKSSPQEIKNQKIANELRIAANTAEHSLRSLLMGVDNLRAVAAALENAPKFQDTLDDYPDFLHEDSASGPAL